MRPIRRGQSPRASDYADYTDAKPDLVSRLGPYCSFCERRVVTQLAVEHIQPKALAAYSALSGCWDNFLLACVNCNSTKKDKDVGLDRTLLPDRDNTFLAFEYLADGSILPMAVCVAMGLGEIAEATLRLTGLDKAAMDTPDANGRQVALDRRSQRMEVWLTAEEARRDLDAQPGNAVLHDYVVKLALETGFFSVWMTVFDDDPAMCVRLIEAFAGTQASGCFDPLNGRPVSPAPNPDGLANGGKL